MEKKIKNIIKALNKVLKNANNFKEIKEVHKNQLICQIKMTNLVELSLRNIT